MKILISPIGDSDPIRNKHDGSMLHIARVKRPDKIYLIFSEKMLPKKEAINKAIASIKDYNPKIEYFEEVISDNEIALYDPVFKIIDKHLPLLVKNIREENHNENIEILLNLTSGTPQLKNALRTVNIIHQLNCTNMMVLTHKLGSNAGTKHDNYMDIDQSIATNLDNADDFVDRTRIDTGDELYKMLAVRNLRGMIKQYDFYGALQLVKNQQFLDNQKEIKKELELIVDSIHRHDSNKIINHYFPKTNEDIVYRRAWFANSLALIEYKTGNVASSLIRTTSITEYLLREYFNRNFLGLLDPKDSKSFNRNYDKIITRNFDKHVQQNNNILEFYRCLLVAVEADSRLIDNLKNIQDIVLQRNDVAHHLTIISDLDSSKLQSAIQGNWKIFKIMFPKASLSLLFDPIKDKLLESI